MKQQRRTIPRKEQADLGNRKPAVMMILKFFSKDKRLKVRDG